MHLKLQVCSSYTEEIWSDYLLKVLLEVDAEPISVQLLDSELLPLCETEGPVE